MTAPQYAWPLSSGPQLIGLTGRAGAGKSTVARYLEDTWACVELAFADPIVNMIAALFAEADIDGAWMTDRRLKESPTAMGYSYRQLAQTLGSGWGRGLHPDFWVRIMQLRLAQPHLATERVVISDVRFPNEAACIAARGGVLIRVVRNTTPAVRDHESEWHTEGLAVHAELLNAGSKDTLHEQVDRLMDGLINRSARCTTP